MNEPTHKTSNEINQERTNEPTKERTNELNNETKNKQIKEWTETRVTGFLPWQMTVKRMLW